VPRGLATEWPFTNPRFVGRDLSWDARLALEKIEPSADRPRRGASVAFSPLAHSPAWPEIASAS
jgi:hypothetical protein